MVTMVTARPMAVPVRLSAGDTPAAVRRAGPRPGFLASMVVSACLGVPPWTTVDHNI